MMKKLLSALLALSLCASLAAAEEPEGGETPLQPWEHAAPTRVWGRVSPWEGDGIFLKNDDKDDPMNEVVVHIGDAPVVDAATGLPLDLEKVKEGDTLYAWIGPAATMSLPPQVFAKVIVGSVPEDAACPEYYELTSGGWIDPAGSNKIVFGVKSEDAQSHELSIPLNAEVTPWLTRQIIRLEGIEPGSQILVWRDQKGTVTKVLVFPYAYRGAAAWNTEAMGIVNGEMIGVPGKVIPGENGKIYLLPVRALAEAAGYDVRWDKDLGAVVSLNGETVFSVKPGADVLQTPDGEAVLSASCLLENGVTYLPAEDLCRWLNLYYTIA